MLRLASFKHKQKHFLVQVFFIFWICYSCIYIAVKRRVWNTMTIWSCGCPNLLLNFSTYDSFMDFFCSTWKTLYFVLLGRNVEHLIRVLATEVVLISLQQPKSVQYSTVVRHSVAELLNNLPLFQCQTYQAKQWSFVAFVSVIAFRAVVSSRAQLYLLQCGNVVLVNFIVMFISSMYNRNALLVFVL